MNSIFFSFIFWGKGICETRETWNYTPIVITYVGKRPMRRGLSSSNYLDTRATFFHQRIIALYIHTVFLLLLIRH